MIRHDIPARIIDGHFGGANIALLQWLSIFTMNAVLLILLNLLIVIEVPEVPVGECVVRSVVDLVVMLLDYACILFDEVERQRTPTCCIHGGAVQLDVRDLGSRHQRFLVLGILALGFYYFNAMSIHSQLELLFGDICSVLSLAVIRGRSDCSDGHVPQRLTQTLLCRFVT